MPFELGKSGNPQGRPKGAKGQIPLGIKEAISEALESRSNQIAAKLDAVTNPVTWLELYAKFAVFVVPKNQKIELTDDLESWTDAELESHILAHSLEFLQEKGYTIIEPNRQFGNSVRGEELDQG